MNNLSDLSFLGALGLKGLTTATLFSVANKYFNQLELKDKALYMGFFGSLGSSLVAELLMTSILQRLLSMSSNAGVKKIFDQGLNSAISGAINLKAYDMLVKKSSSIEGNIFQDKQEFMLQAACDVIAEIICSNYLNALLGFNSTNITALYG